MTDFGSKLKRIERILDMGEHTIVAKECVGLIEQALRQLFSQALTQLDERDRLKVQEAERKIGKGEKGIESFTMGQLVGVFRTSHFLDAWARASGKDLSSIRVINLDELTQLRNKFIHEGIEATRSEAELLLDCLRVILETFGVADLEDAGEAFPSGTELNGSVSDIAPGPRKETSYPDVKEDIHDVEEELQRLKQTIKIRDQKIKFRKYTKVIAYVVILLMFSLSWVKFFDFLTLDTRIESYTMWLGDLFTEKTFSEQIVMVSINEQTEETLGKRFDRSWRKEHAVLVDKLSQTGAKVIAFDMLFEESNPVDQEFIHAIEKAKQRGSAVIVGVVNLEGNEPVLAKGLKQVVSGFGFACASRKLGNAIATPLAIMGKDNYYLLSLTFKAVEAFRNEEYRNVVGVDSYQITMWDSHTESAKQFGFSILTPIMQSQPGCQVFREGDNVVDIFIDVSPLETLRNSARRYAYEEVIRADSDELEQWKKRFNNKIVLVGVEKESDIHLVGLLGERRYGLELHADALNTILNNVTIRSLGTMGQLAIMICLGLLGASIRYWTPQTWRYRRIGFFLVGLIAYLASTIYVYSQYHVLLNTMYHGVTFWFTYWVTGKIERKYFV